MSGLEQNKKLYKRAYDTVRVSPEMKERLIDMKYADMPGKTVRSRKPRMGVRIAAAVIVFVLLSCTSVYAAQRLNWFDGLFADSEVSLIDGYVETPDSVISNGAYQDENDKWLVTVEQFLYNDATDYGIVQFTVTDKTGNAGQWYETVGRDPIYESWEMPAVQEIYSDHLSIMASDDTGFYSDRLFLVEADENTTRCQMTLKCIEAADMKNSQPQITVYEREGDEMNEILRLDVPMGNSLPSYCWRNADGEVRLLLSSVDFLLCDAPESSYFGDDIVVAEVSVQMKDGSSYVIMSDSEKISHKFFSTLSETGLWYCFDRIIDLENIVSFTVDGEVFYTADAVIE